MEQTKLLSVIFGYLGCGGGGVRTHGVPGMEGMHGEGGQTIDRDFTF